MSEKMSKTDKLQAMMGRHFKNNDNDEVIHFMSFKQTGDQITIATDKDWILTTPFDLNNFFRKYQEVQVTEKGVSIPAVYNPPVSISSQIMKDDIVSYLTDTLKDNIKKVQENKDYVPQAKEISNSISRLIDLAKIELEFKRK